MPSKLCLRVIANAVFLLELATPNAESASVQ